MLEGAVPMSFILESVVYGHHICKQIWAPFLGEKLLIGIEEDNSELVRGPRFRCIKVITRCVHGELLITSQIIL